MDNWFMASGFGLLSLSFSVAGVPHGAAIAAMGSTAWLASALYADGQRFPSTIVEGRSVPDE